MKVTAWIDEGKVPKMKIRLDSENQKEAAEIYEAALRCKHGVATYGKVSPDTTWAWFFIPLTVGGPKDFGNGVDATDK